jgi:hypothetical protein
MTEHTPALASGQAPSLELRLMGEFPQDPLAATRPAIAVVRFASAPVVGTAQSAMA